MTDLSNQDCQSCKFWMHHVMADPQNPNKVWAEGARDVRIGGCHRLPPSINRKKDINGFANMAQWPLSYGYDWCGSWELMLDEDCR